MEEINARCCKCGCTSCEMEYDYEFKRLETECNRCGYSWSIDPLDKKPEPTKEGE